MNILIMVLIGFVVGTVAKALMPGKDPGGWILTTVLGIVGALMAGYLGRGLGWYGQGQAAGFIAAVFGAMLLLLGHRLVWVPART